MGGWATFCAAIAVLQAAQYYSRFLRGELRVERLERSLLEWRLNALRLHLEPHFLFNALNAISSEVETRPRLARDMIADLGALLRRSLDSKDSLEISLTQELALLDHYLAIQKVRFGNRLDIKIDVEPEATSARVPSMLLQPLVENAIRHGIEKRRSGGQIAVTARKAGDRLQVNVVDDGAGLPGGWTLENVTGHGLRVTLERLLALYPECGGDCLTVERRGGGGTQVSVRIPLRTIERDAASG
jgi:LytS/YehU family sensor histidine kinase